MSTPVQAPEHGEQGRDRSRETLASGENPRFGRIAQTQRPGQDEEGFDLASPVVKKRMLIIVNPYASTVSDGLRHLVVHALQGRFEVDAVDTEARGHATELCREAAQEGYDVVVAFGGDGTVNEAANGLLGSPTPLTCLPGGSANVFGKMLGIPGEPSTPPSTCWAWPTTGACTGSTSASSTGAASRSPPASASTPLSCNAWTPARG